jgi:hypothetical protein
MDKVLIQVLSYDVKIIAVAGMIFQTLQLVSQIKFIIFYRLSH